MPEYGDINQEVVKDQVERAAAALQILPLDWWPAWIAFFLEQLEGRIGDRPGAFDQVLNQVAAIIERRLTSGSW